MSPIQGIIASSKSGHLLAFAGYAFSGAQTLSTPPVASASNYTTKNTYKFPYLSETWSTQSATMLAWWAQPATLSNFGNAAYIFSSNRGTGVFNDLPGTGGTLTTIVEKLLYATDTWTTATGALPAASSTAGQSFTSMNNGSVGGYYFNGTLQSSSGTATAVTSAKITYGVDTWTTTQTWTPNFTGGTPFSVETTTGGRSFQANSYIPQISNAGVKGYLEGAGSYANSGTSPISFFGWSFSTNTYSAAINTIAGNVGSYALNMVNNSVASYVWNPSSPTPTIYKMPFSTETWSATAITWSVTRVNGTILNYSGICGYYANGSNTSNTDKLNFNTDVRSIISSNPQYQLFVSGGASNAQ